MASKWGEIISPDRFRQPLIFDGVKRGKIQPTDIDAMMELQDRAYVFIEVKHREKDVPFGQKLALERMVRDARRVGKKAVAFVVSHCVDDPRLPVSLADCTVTEVYYSDRLRWEPVGGEMRTADALDSFMRFLGIW